MAFSTEVDTEASAFGPTGAIPSGKYRTPPAINALGSGLGGEASPGPGHTDGLEPGTDNPTHTIGDRKRRAGEESVSMGRRGYSPASTMLQGSRKLG